MDKNVNNQLQLVNQAITASINSLNLTRQLIHELERSFNVDSNTARTVSTPGIMGKYDGENMVADGTHEKYPVSQNYSSKSELVYGDTLKRIMEGQNPVFKQVQRVRRLRAPGLLVKKDGRWAIVTDGGSYKTLDASVEHFKLKENDEVFAIIPENNKGVPFAAIAPKRAEAPKEQQPTVQSHPVAIEQAVKEAKEEVQNKDGLIAKAEVKREEKKPVVVKVTPKVTPRPAFKPKKEEMVVKKDEGMSISEEPKKPTVSLSDEDLR